MKLGISSYTYNWWAGVPGYPLPADPLTPEALLDRAEALGVGVVQIADNLPLDRASADRLAVSNRHAGIEIEIGTRGILPENLLPYLDIAGILGCTLIRTLLDSDGHHPDESEAVRRLREIAPEFERAEVTLAIENHDRFRAATLRRIIDSTASSSVGICLDTANSLGCGEGIETVLDYLVEVAVNVHIKDFTVQRLPHGKGFLVTGTPAGQGMLGVPRLLERLDSANRNCNCILELWSPPEPGIDESIRKEIRWAEESLRYLRGLIR
jgi:sugar phosphate isomerase/epimerase